MVASKYRLDRLVYQGLHTEVWVGRELGPAGRPVAVKRIGPGNGTQPVGTLGGEARRLVAVAHPRIVELLAVVDDPPGIALVLAWMAGGSLRDLLDQRGTLVAGALVAVLADVAEALTAIADRGLVHGDLKPSNLLLTADGRAMVADLGVARLTGPVAPGLTVAGTPAYLDPAVVLGGAPLGPAADVYALGVVAYECLTGRLPHRGPPAEAVALAAAGAHRPLAGWPGIPAAVAPVVEAALSPHPEDRPADAAAFVAALRATVDPATVVLPGPARPRDRPAVAPPDETLAVPVAAVAPGPARPRRSRRLVVAVAVALAVALAAVGVAAAVGRGPFHRTRRGPDPGPAAPSTTTRSTPCPPRSPAAERTTSVDTDGDGCPDATWDERTRTVTRSVGPGRPAIRYRVGGPHDVVRFGDWDGNGTATPALYQPAAGRVLYLDRWPDAGGPVGRAGRVEPAVRHGRARVVRGRSGADRLVVSPR